MTTATRQQIEEQVAAIPYWYHKIPLPHGVVTPGWAPLDPDAYGVPADLSGRRVLDIGAWDGYWTFAALARGAAQVVAVDDFSDHLGTGSRAPSWAPFDLCRSLLGYSDEQCQRRSMSLYDVRPAELGTFDTVFLFGTLYHLRHPLLGIERAADVCTGDMYVESAILDDYSPYRGGLGKGYPGGQMVMEFYPGTEYGNNSTNWWVPTLHCLAQMVLSCGFRQARAWKLTNEPSHVAACRGFVEAVR